MAVERATTLQNLPPRHEEANAAVPRGNSPPTRGEEPGDMVVDEMASPARIVVLSPQGSSSDGTESSTSGPVRGAEESGPVLRLREAEQEQARGRSPQWWYGGTKAQETEQEEARNSTVPPSRWFLVP